MKIMRPKLKLLILILPIVAGLSALLAGCAGTTYTYQDAPPTPVKFESIKAQQTFYDALLVKYFPAFDNRSKGFYFESNLVAIGWNHGVCPSSNVIFNEAVALADANHDGTITETEAQAYAATIAARTDKQKDQDAVWNAVW
jgi:hypothetical protein